MKPQVNGTRVVFGPVRLSYTHLLEKYAGTNNEATPKFMTNALIPKNDKATVAAIEAAIEAAKRQGVTTKWKGIEPKKLALPMRDGDEKDNAPEYENMWYINAKSSSRPGVIDRNNNPLTDEEDVYSGMWALLSVTFYPYEASGNKGVAAGLNNVMKYKDDERFGGGSSAASDFAGVTFDDEDDDDL